MVEDITEHNEDIREDEMFQQFVESAWWQSESSEEGITVGGNSDDEDGRRNHCLNIPM